MACKRPGVQIPPAPLLKTLRHRLGFRSFWANRKGTPLDSRAVPSIPAIKADQVQNASGERRHSGGDDESFDTALITLCKQLGGKYDRSHYGATATSRPRTSNTLRAAVMRKPYLYGILLHDAPFRSVSECKR